MSASPVNALFAELIAELEDAPRFDVELFLREHPEHAAALRERLEKLRRAGFLGAAPNTGNVLHEMRERFGVSSVVRTLAPAAEAAHAPGELLPSRVVGGRYRIVAEIGRGGMGRVFRALDVDLGREVALKVIDLEPTVGADTPQRRAFVERFLTEAQLTAQLEHPSIVPLHDLGIDRTGQLYYTMKLVEGRTLEELIGEWHADLAAGKPFPITELLRIVLQICDALALAHERGVIHRDLKPSNVMIGRFGEVYVMDWGVAKLTRAAEAEIGDLPGPSRSATGIGAVVGTPSFMAPEQASGDPAVIDRRTDVFGVGAILVHTLIGPQPRGHRVTAHWVTPPELQAICDRSQQLDPGERYATTTELAEDVRSYLDHRVVKAYRTGAWVELRKWIERNKRFAWASAAALLLALSGLVTVSWVEARGRQRALSQRDSTGRVVDVFIEILESFTPSVAQGEPISAVELIDFCREHMEKTLTRDEDAWARARLNLALGRGYRSLGELQAAALQLEKGIAALAAQQDPSAADTLQARLDLGAVYHRQGRLEPARGEFRSVLEATAPGEEMNLHARGSIAILECEEGDYAAAQLSNEALLGLVAGRAEEDPLRLTVQENLAAVLRLRGQQPEAKALLEHILEIRTRTDGPTHPLTIHAQHSLGIVLAEMERLEEAAPLLQHALETREQILGEHDSEIARARLNEGMRLADLGRNAEARALYEEALVTLEATLGGTHVDTINCLGRLGLALARLGEIEEGVRLGERALELAGSLDEKHPLRSICAGHLACCYSDMGRHEEAESLGAEALAGMVEHLGDRHPNSLEMRWNLAHILGRGGHEEDAKALLREILEFAPESASVRKAAAEKLGSLEPAPEGTELDEGD